MEGETGREGDGDEEMEALLSSSRKVPVPRGHFEDEEEAAEVAMMREGLAKSQTQDLRSAARSPMSFVRRGSLFFSSAEELLGPTAAAIAPTKVDDLELAEITATVNVSKAAERDAECKSAKTVLMMPFSFWPTEDKESPAFLARQMLERTVRLGEDEAVPLWERTGLPKEAAELSLHFRQLLGHEATELSPVQRLRVSDRARTRLFGEPRLWGDTKTGDFAGKQCEWTDVHLVIFPHGAILSITIDWIMRGDTAPFMLSDLRTWLYLSKFRSVKLGVTRGWSFEQRQVAGEAAGDAQETLGLKLYAALFGGSCIALGAVANWLVKLPDESCSAIPRRIARFDYCHHHTCALIVKPPPKDAFDEYLFHIRRANGSKSGTFNLADGWKQPGLTDRVLALRANALIATSREGLFGVEWGTPKKTFLKQFVGIFCVLTLHCLSERVTLEKLSYLAALESQNLPTPGSNRSLAEKDLIRRKLMSLATLLVRYRSAMASDDCGGRSEFRDYFQTLRQVFNVAPLKDELREELQDTLAIVESDWMEEKRNEKNSELLWKLKKEEISKRKEDITNHQKRIFDVIYSAFSALGLPFILVSNIWSMNNSDLPRNVSWAYLMMSCGLVSVVLFFLVYVNFNRGRPELLALSREEQLLNAIRREKFEGTTVAEEVLAAEKPAVRRKLFRLPKWPTVRRPKFGLQLEPLGEKRDETMQLVHDNVELDQYLDRLEAGEVEEQRPFEGPNYLEPDLHREYSIDLVRPMPPSVTPPKAAAPVSSRNSKRWFSWLRPGASAAGPISSRPDGFADLAPPIAQDEVERDADQIEYVVPSTRGFSLDIQRPMPPTEHRSTFFNRLRSATARPTHSAPGQCTMGVPLPPVPEALEEILQLDEPEGRRLSLEGRTSIDYMLPQSRGFSLDIERPLSSAPQPAKPSLFAKLRTASHTKSAPPAKSVTPPPPTVAQREMEVPSPRRRAFDDLDLPRRGSSLDIPRK